MEVIAYALNGAVLCRAEKRRWALRCIRKGQKASKPGIAFEFETCYSIIMY